MDTYEREVIGTEDLAVEVGVSRQMIGRWGREGMAAAAKVRHGKWDRETALAWIADRREDSLNANVGGDGENGGKTGSDLLDARTRLYELQGNGQSLRNDLLEANVVYRESAITAYQEGNNAAVACLDAWVRRGRTAQQIAERQEAANELRTTIAAAVRRVSGTLERGEDVGSTRVRIPRRMGG